MQGRPATGTVVGTGAAINIECGFTPVRVVVTNITSRDGLEWTRTMTNGHALKTVAAGTRSAITSLGITPYAGTLADDSTGFTIGADTDVNVTAEVIHWTAW